MLYILFIELYGYWNLNSYKRQNIPVSYFPFLGHAKLLIDKQNPIKCFNDFFKSKKHQDQDLIVTNTTLSSKSNVWINSLKSLREFVTKENDCV